jgi:hypothetical protein
MSFDIFFQPCRFHCMSGQVNDPLTPIEAEAVLWTLKGPNARKPDQHGCYVVELDDGGCAEVFASELKKGCMVALRGLTPGITQFRFDLLDAGKWVMLPAMEDTVAITCCSENAKRLPPDFPKLVVCGSADELAVLLTSGVQAWEKYRNQVVGKGQP